MIIGIKGPFNENNHYVFPTHKDFKLIEWSDRDNHKADAYIQTNIKGNIKTVNADKYKWISAQSKPILVVEQATYEIKFKFTEANVLNIDIEPTDLLFLDTWHIYDQLKAELARHHGQVKKYICLHDTTSFAHHGESTSSHHEFHGEITQGKGLWDAVTEFLEEYSNEWELEHRFENNNGFTILKRK